MIDVPGDLVWDLPCMQQASYLEGGPVMWMLPLYLHVNQKSDYDIYDYMFRSAEQNGHQSKKKEKKNFKKHLLRGHKPDFRIISQNRSSYGPLPKLLKWFCSAEQNGCQS